VIEQKKKEEADSIIQNNDPVFWRNRMNFSNRHMAEYYSQRNKKLVWNKHHAYPDPDKHAVTYCCHSMFYNYWLDYTTGPLFLLMIGAFIFYIVCLSVYPYDTI
jgi:hypothetical protein